tara:strand:+ start:759 stop:1229 length:471 start_codon:yes stop_codon:yes gene_type:complete
LSKNDINKVALFILHTKDLRYLLQNRSDDAPRIPGFWGFFGGSIKGKETIVSAVKREALEEIDYKLLDPHLVFEQYFYLTTEHQTVKKTIDNGYMWVFIELFKGNMTSINVYEGKNFGWFKKNETYSLQMMEHDRFVLEKVEEYLLKDNLSSRMDL